ncbi:hypothetical protein [Haloplasma contractile]|nr:hypothetical protein [Haloplasma contractile]
MCSLRHYYNKSVISPTKMTEEFIDVDPVTLNEIITTAQTVAQVVKVMESPL